MTTLQTSLVIVGGGAAGLMAACTATEAGLDCLLVERRHRPGLKLLLCGNGRCNVSHWGTAEELASAYGQPVGDFLLPALRQFPPARLKAWFEDLGLPLKVLRHRFYPRSEKSDDVLHAFTDYLRDKETPTLFNCQVKGLKRLDSGFLLDCGKLTIRAEKVLLATGGASYPKTGSTGEGYSLAVSLGHACKPLQAGLVGVESSSVWLSTAQNGLECNLPEVRMSLESGGREIYISEGNLLIDSNIVRGSAIFDCMRIVARRQLSQYSLYVDLFPNALPRDLATMLQKIRRSILQARDIAPILNAAGLELRVADGLTKQLGNDYNRDGDEERLADLLKHLPLEVSSVRPLKEAIVTVGGIALEEINPATMESRLVPGLFFAGEVMDVDGPTGGYNLHAAFATARLAVKSLNGQPARPEPRRAAAQTPRQGRSKKGKSAWGKDLWKGYLR